MIACSAPLQVGGCVPRGLDSGHTPSRCQDLMERERYPYTSGKVATERSGSPPVRCHTKPVQTTDTAPVTTLLRVRPDVLSCFAWSGSSVGGSCTGRFI